MANIHEKTQIILDNTKSNFKYTINKNGFVCFKGEDGKLYESGFTEAGYELILKKALGL